MSDIIEVTEKEGVIIEEYDGKFSLIACYNGYKQWGKYRVSKDSYSLKDRPIKVTLGTR